MDIVIKNLSKNFDSRQVLQDISITFKSGCHHVIIGKSGRGKTTLFRILLGLTKADCGIIEGLENKRVSAVFQENRLCEHITALNNVRMVSDGKYTMQEYEAMFNAVSLSNTILQPISSLSGGMKRRVSILRALAYQPNVLFMDEPYQGLDEQTYKLVSSYVKSKTKDITVITISHDTRDLNEEGIIVHDFDKILTS